MVFEEKTIRRTTVYRGSLLTVRQDEVQLEDGKSVIREMIEHPGGVAIAAMNPMGEVLVVSQYRYAQQKILKEFPAGKRELGEDPLVTARRELEEETGYQAEHWLYLGEMIPTGAYLEETIQMYLAWGLRFSGAHPDSDEFLEVAQIPLDLLLEEVMDGSVTDAKTIAMTLKIHRMQETGKCPVDKE